MKIWLKILKRWGELTVGSVVQFDAAKGRRVIAGGFAVEVPDPTKQREKFRGRGPKVETADARPAPETTEARPQIEK